jgi:hypothetical protein
MMSNGFAFHGRRRLSIEAAFRSHRLPDPGKVAGTELSAATAIDPYRF